MNDSDIEQQMVENELPSPISVWVNAGFGNRSYHCVINSDNMITLPEPLVKEMGMQIGDELNWSFNEDDGIIYISVKEKLWGIPEWLNKDE